MTGNSSKLERKRDLEKVLEDEPESKRGTEGKTAHGGDQAGPSSAEAGKVQAPQKGDPHADDRRPS